jgi:hypothetical protein
MDGAVQGVSRERERENPIDTDRFLMILSIPE